jgi:hypothetical protein
VKRSTVPPVSWTAAAASHIAPTLRAPMGDSSSQEMIGVPASSAAAIALLRATFGGDVEPLTVERFPEKRGTLTAFDFDRLPFAVQRVFTVNDVPAGERRGGHGHRRGTQALFCIEGRVDVELRRGDTTAEIALYPDGVGLRIAAGVWSRQHYALDGSTLLVLASEPYDPTSYD